MTKKEQINSIASNEIEAVAMACYFSIINTSTTSNEKMLEIWRLVDRSEYLKQAELILEILK